MAGWLISLTHDLPSSFALSGLPVHVAASQRAPFSLGRQQECDETHVDDHRGERCAEEFQVVPIAVRPAGDVPGPSRLWSASRLGWNRLALPPSVGGARASLLDEPGRGVAWQRPPVVLPSRRFRNGTEESTRSGRPVRRGAPREPEHSNTGVLTPGSGRILRHDQCALCAPAKGAREAAAY